MSTICIIGNSHAGCLRAPSLALTQTQKDMEFVFFCAKTAVMQALVRRGQFLLPQSADLKSNFKRTSKGGEKIETDRYDAFIVVGLQFGIEAVLQIYRDYRTSEMSHSRRKYLVSEDYFRSAACDALRASEALRIVKMIRSMSRSLIILIPNPRRVLDFQGKGYKTMWDASDTELTLLDREYRVACASAVPASIFVHHQPDETLSDGFHTRTELGMLHSRSVKSPVLPEVTEHKFTHMNETYGSLLLNSVAGRLSSSMRTRWAKGS